METDHGTRTDGELAREIEHHRNLLRAIGKDSPRREEIELALGNMIAEQDARKELRSRPTDPTARTYPGAYAKRR